MSEDKKPKPELALLIRTEESRDYYHSFKVSAVVRVYNPAKPEKWTYPDEYIGGPFYSNLAIDCTTFADSIDPSNQAHIGYHDSYRSVELREAEKMYTTLKMIDRKMEKMRQAEGWPQTFGQTINRVARTIGAKTILIESKRHLEITGERYHNHALGFAVGVVDSLISTWLSGIKKAKEQPAEQPAEQ